MWAFYTEDPLHGRHKQVHLWTNWRRHHPRSHSPLGPFIVCFPTYPSGTATTQTLFDNSCTISLLLSYHDTTVQMSRQLSVCLWLMGVRFRLQFRFPIQLGTRRRPLEPELLFERNVEERSGRRRRYATSPPQSGSVGRQLTLKVTCRMFLHPSKQDQLLSHGTLGFSQTLLMRNSSLLRTHTLFLDPLRDAFHSL